MNSIIVFCAQYLFYVVAAVAFVYWLRLAKRQKVEVIIFGVVTLVVAFIMAKLGGMLFYNPRPFVSDHIVSLFPYVADNGFPSDHTLFSTVIAITIFSVSKKWGLMLGALAVVVGVSRVLAHVHHPIDIVASLIIGTVAGLAGYFLTPKIIRFARNR